MALPLAIAQMPWDEYIQPIRLPEGEDNMGGDEMPPTPPPENPPDDENSNDDGTSLIDLLQRRDPLADLSLRASLSEDMGVICKLSHVLGFENGETCLLLASVLGLPLHAALLCQEGCSDILSVKENQEIDLRNHPKKEVLVHRLPQILKAAYGGPGYRGSTRYHLLHLLESEEHCDGKVRCGDEVYNIHKFLLAHRSDYFRAAFAHCSHHNSDTPSASTIDLPHEYLKTPGILKLLLRYCYTFHQAEMDDLLSNIETLVEVAFTAGLLMLPELKDAALDIASEAVDSSNAPSLLAVAQSLDHDGLRRKCIAHMVKHLGEVARTAPHFSQVVGAKEYDWLQRLSEASLSNPVACGIVLTDEREYIAMLSEALDTQRIQFCEATARQAEEIKDLEQQEKEAMEAEKKAAHYHTHDSVFHDIAARLKLQVASRRSRLDLVEQSLKMQSRHIEFLDGFLKTAANASVQAQQRMNYEASSSDKQPLERPSKAARAEDVPADDARMEDEEDEEQEFIPRYEWQIIRPRQQIPAGLDIRVNINAGFGGDGYGAETSTLESARRARIPPVWRLKLWVECCFTIENEHGEQHASMNRRGRYYRQDVRRDDDVGSIEVAIAKEEKLAQGLVKLVVFEPQSQMYYHLDPSTTFEPYFFIHQRDLKVVIGDTVIEESRYPLIRLHSSGNELERVAGGEASIP